MTKNCIDTDNDERHVLTRMANKDLIVLSKIDSQVSIYISELQKYGADAWDKGKTNKIKKSIK